MPHRYVVAATYSVRNQPLLTDLGLRVTKLREKGALAAEKVKQKPYMVSNLATSAGEFRVAVGYGAEEGKFYADVVRLIGVGSRRANVEADSLFELLRMVDQAISSFGGVILDRGGLPGAEEIDCL